MYSQRLTEPQLRNAPFAFFLLCLYTASVLIRPHEFSIETSQMQFTRYFAIASFLALFLTLRPIRFTPQLIMLLILTPLIMISAYLNGWGTAGLIQSERLFVNSIIPFFLFSSLIATPGRQRTIMYLSLLAALIMVVNGHVQQASFDGQFGYGVGDSKTVNGEEMRITYLGFFSDPNDLGMFLTMNIPFAVYFSARSSKLLKIGFAAIVPVLVYGIYMTRSRGTLLAGLGIAAAYFLISRASTKLIITLAVAAPFVATLLSSYGGLTAADASVDGRLEAWYAGIHMLANNPVFGIGMGNFVEEHVRVAHNSYIHVAAELGVPGYSLWGGVIVLNLLAAYRLVREYDRGNLDDGSVVITEGLAEELELNKTMLFSIIAFAIAAFFLSRQYVLTMFIFLGLQTANLIRIENHIPEMSEHFSMKAIVKAMGIAWIIIIAVYLTLKLAL